MTQQLVQVQGTVDVQLASPTVLSVSQGLGTDTLSNAGTATNVLAGQVYAQITNPPAGFYVVDVWRAADGSGNPTLYNNGQIAFGADTRTLMDLPELGLVYHYQFFVDLNGSESIQVKAANNGSPQITVTALITATRIR